jgi:hypothetical protein
MDAQNAGAFARGRANAASEFRKVICFVQSFQRFVPEAAINKIVPFWDQIVDGTATRHATDQLACVAKRNPTVHAARTLKPKFILRHVMMKFFPVANTVNCRTIQRQFSEVLYESSGFTHFNQSGVRR